MSPNTVNNVEIPRGKLCGHVMDEIGPLGREIGLSDDGDGVAQLLLNPGRGFQHEIYDHVFDGQAVFRVNLVVGFLGLERKKLQIGILSRVPVFWRETDPST